MHDGEITQILGRIDRGDPQAAAQLLPLLYDELRRLAAAQLAREKPGQTLQATALVHEAYLRLSEGHPVYFDTAMIGVDYPAFGPLDEPLQRRVREAPEQEEEGGASGPNLMRSSTPSRVWVRKSGVRLRSSAVNCSTWCIATKAVTRSP